MSRLIVMTLLISGLAGCASAIPDVPPPAPAGTSSSAQVADESACWQLAQNQEHARELYLACLLSRGYEVPYERNLLVRVEQFGKPAAKIAEELRECERLTRETSGAEKYVVFSKCAAPLGYEVKR